MAVRTAHRILGNEADAEDAAQQAFMDAFGVLRKSRVQNWAALLRHLAACRALDILRRRAPAGGAAVEPLAGGASHPEAVAVARERAVILRQALGALPEREAQVFSLRYFGDLSNPDIAAMLGIPAGAVAVALHKARAHLEEAMREDET
jgi:RNA polymerase sigma-70 factor (ECF subfamily)